MKAKLAEVAGVGRPEDAVPRLRQGKRQAETMYVGEQTYQVTPDSRFPAQPLVSGIITAWQSQK